MTISAAIYEADEKGNQAKRKSIQVYPAAALRPVRRFHFAPDEAHRAYVEACGLAPIHTGAAGAYARRALELVLDNAGYAAPVLAESIKALGQEQDPDKRLPRALQAKLDYVREIGNFALHVRRDGELTIVEINAQEVEACLETVEALLDHLFERPVNSYREILEMNVKLAAVNKKPINLPPLPPGVTTDMVFAARGADDVEADAADAEN